MPNFFSWISSCCSSADVVDTSASPANQPAPTTSAAPAKHQAAIHHPSSHGRHSSRHDDEAVRPIPLEYVNPEVEIPEEVAMKGRRQSTGTLLNPSPSIGSSGEHGWQQDDISGSSAHRDTPPSPQHRFGDSSSGEVLEAHPQSPSSVTRHSGLPSLLGPQLPPVVGRKCLVLDLDETLVHSSFKALDFADFVIRVEIEEVVHDVYVVKRPGIDEFLEAVSKMYEVVIFTASVSKYGDPLLDHLDTAHHIHHRLFRESCYNYNGVYIKDLSQLGRPLEDVIIIDNSPGSYALQPHNAVPVSSWFSDMHDNELLDMLPLLEDLSGARVPDVSVILQASW